MLFDMASGRYLYKAWLIEQDSEDDLAVKLTGETMQKDGHLSAASPVAQAAHSQTTGPRIKAPPVSQAALYTREHARVLEARLRVEEVLKEAAARLGCCLCQSLLRLLPFWYST